MKKTFDSVEDQRFECRTNDHPKNNTIIALSILTSMLKMVVEKILKELDLAMRDVLQFVLILNSYLIGDSPPVMLRRSESPNPPESNHWLTALVTMKCYAEGLLKCLLASIKVEVKRFL